MEFLAFPPLADEAHLVHDLLHQVEAQPAQLTIEAGLGIVISHGGGIERHPLIGDDYPQPSLCPLAGHREGGFLPGLKGCLDDVGAGLVHGQADAAGLVLTEARLSSTGRHVGADHGQVRRVVRHGQGRGVFSHS